MNSILLKFSFFVIFCVNLAKAQTITLQIGNGSIIGKTGYTVNKNIPWYVFLGIPYAEPPVRFELPVIKGPWTTPIDCTYDKPQCVQGGITTPVVGQEDCLTLSVYTPNITGNYPVLVWIHGGYFTEGNGSYHNQAPDLLVEEGIVFVEIQYRLGVFGFLSTNDTACPGNLGLKDQALALLWVQQNIRYFGGDPTKVTLGGQSAGAASASLHLLSPRSTGLFHSLILNSASALNLWAYNRRAKRTAYGIGVALLVPSLTSSQLIAGLKRKNYKLLQEASVTVSSVEAAKDPLAGIWYGYVSEPDHPDAFFIGNAENRLSTGDFIKLPVMQGFTSNEAIFFGTITALIRTYLVSYDAFYTRLVPVDMNANWSCELSSGTKIKSQYFPIGFVAISTDTDIYNFITADQFSRPMVQTADDISKYLPDSTYFYQFSYVGELSNAGVRPAPGVGHGEDLSYLFVRNRTYTIPDQDYIVRNQTVRLWANFVKYQNPTPSADPLLNNVIWPPFVNSNSTDTYYLNINTELQVLTNPKNADIQFYKEIYAACGAGNYDTY